MKESEVIIVPETDKFIQYVLLEGKVWININLGVPGLESHNARYLAPYWLHNNRGADRVFHIIDVKVKHDATEIKLGNSFILKRRLSGLTQRRVFSYKKLSELGFIEIREGLLLVLPDYYK